MGLIQKIRKLRWEYISEQMGLILGLAVSVILTPKDGFMLFNALSMWLPQIFVLGFLRLFKPRPSASAGAALVMALYLIAIAVWISSVSKYDHNAAFLWMGYWLSFPGAFIGALVATLTLRKFPAMGALSAGCTTAVFVYIGLLISQTAICDVAPLSCEGLSPLFHLSCG
jgi:hypothetical protein